jgi:H+/Cl- antiporter ClcA
MSNQINQFFGGPPLSVAVRLVLLSILVGVILSAVGLDPLNLWRSLQNLVRQIWEMGFDAFWWLWRYFLLGAVLVIPIWLVVRVAKGARGRA